MKAIVIRLADLGGEMSWHFLDEGKADERFKELTEAWRGGNDFVIVADEIETDYTMLRLDKVLAIELKSLCEASEQDHIAKEVIISLSKKRIAAAVREQASDSVGFK
jgi:hypothetical protein